MTNTDCSNYKQSLLENEQMILASWATYSVSTKGRKFEETVCPLRLDFQRDRDRIIHSKAFRRLKHKTQVFIAPEGDHYRTRLTHTLEVAQIARTIARLLHLNEDLTEAISLGHDLGHTPFGHAGENALNQLLTNGFAHNNQSLRVVDFLETTERDYPGLNLTFEVRDGIINHTGPKLPITPEGRIVRWADRLAYVNHDLDDALRGKVIEIKDVPQWIGEKLGMTSSERLSVLIQDMVAISIQAKDILFSPGIEKILSEFRAFLFDKVYIGSIAKAEEKKVSKILAYLLEYFQENIHEIPEAIRRYSGGNSELAAGDYIAGMTDGFAIEVFKEKIIPHSWALR